MLSAQIPTQILSRQFRTNKFRQKSMRDNIKLHVLRTIKNVVYNHSNLIYSLQDSAADPDSGSGAFFTPRSGMGKKIQIFWVKNTKFFYADQDPGSEILLALDPG
jgi:hypothetical protein